MPRFKRISQTFKNQAKELWAIHTRFAKNKEARNPLTLIIPGAFLLVVILRAATGMPLGTETTPADNEAFEKEVIFLVNKERASAGLCAVEENSDLTRAARYHANDMMVDDYIGHDTKDRVNGQLVFRCQFGYRVTQFRPLSKGRVTGENCASGFDNPQSVVNAWMNSTWHRAAILNPMSTLIGAGYKKGGSAGHYWVLDFANTFVMGKSDGNPPGAPAIIDTMIENGVFIVSIAGAASTSGLTGYEVSIDGGAWTKIMSSNLASPLTLPNLPPGTQNIRLRGLNVYGAGNPSEEFSVSLPYAKSNTDSDGDGYTDGNETIFGTDPTNASSRPKTELRMEGGVLTLSFPTLAGRSYQVQKSETLESWTNHGSPIIGNGQTKKIACPSPSGSNIFFRVKIQLVL